MIEQGTHAWKMLRLGKVTASRIADLTARTKSGWGAGRANYMADIVCERLTGKATEGFRSSDMDYGNQTEDEARAAYCFFRNAKINEAAFIDHPTIKMAGASPDGLIDVDGLFEVKCPKPATHIATLEGKSIKGVYLKQMQWQMACTGRQWCDFVSYNNDLPEHIQLSIRRVNRDEEMISELENFVIDFLNEVEGKIRYLETLEVA